MNKISLSGFICRVIFLSGMMFLVNTGNATCENPVKADTIKFVDGQSLTIIGKYHSEKNYARFPKVYETRLRKRGLGPRTGCCRHLNPFPN